MPLPLTVSIELTASKKDIAMAIISCAFNLLEKAPKVPDTPLEPEDIQAVKDAATLLQRLAKVIGDSQPSWWLADSIFEWAKPLPTFQKLTVKKTGELLTDLVNYKRKDNALTLRQLYDVRPDLKGNIKVSLEGFDSNIYGNLILPPQNSPAPKPKCNTQRGYSQPCRWC